VVISLCVARVSLAKVLDRCDELPLGPHANRVGEEGIDDFQRHERGQLEILQANANVRCARPNHADAGRGGKELLQARTRILPLVKVQLERIAKQLAETVSAGQLSARFSTSPEGP
jgi:hypothetical protein